MAGLRTLYNFPRITTGTAKKTLIQVLAPANQRLLIPEFFVALHGIAGAEPAVPLHTYIQTSAGTGGVALAAEKWTDTDTETPQATVIHGPTGATWTAEPAGTEVRLHRPTHPQQYWHFRAIPGREIVIPGGTRWALVADATGLTAVNASGYVEVEE